jgi:hypothetical protein
MNQKHHLYFFTLLFVVMYFTSCFPPKNVNNPREIPIDKIPFPDKESTVDVPKVDPISEPIKSVEPVKINLPKGVPKQTPIVKTEPIIQPKPVVHLSKPKSNNGRIPASIESDGNTKPETDKELTINAILKEGYIYFQLPEKMMVDSEANVKVIISNLRDTSRLIKKFDIEDGKISSDVIETGSKMLVTIVANKNFIIQRATNDSILKITSNNIAEWRWFITPKVKGKQKLVVYAKIIDGENNQYENPEREINEKTFFVDAFIPPPIPPLPWYISFLNFAKEYWGIMSTIATSIGGFFIWFSKRKKTEKDNL